MFGPDDYAALAAALKISYSNPDDEAAELEIRRLQWKWTGDANGFGLVVQDCMQRLKAGFVYDPRHDWIAADRDRPHGRPRQRGLETARQLGRIELLDKLKREPALAEIADHVLQSDNLKGIAGVRGLINVSSLVRQFERRRREQAGRK
jgi:hypothetical protein